VWRSRKLRDSKCSAKDLITRKIIESLKVGPDFKCILMPCLYGVELDMFEEKGLGPEQMFAIERSLSIWKLIKKQGRVTVTPRPMKAHVAIDHIEAVSPGPFDFIYGDFLGPPDRTHSEFLRKIFALRMIKSGGTMLLTFGLTRTHKFTKEFNDMLQRLGKTSFVPTNHHVDIALEATEHPGYKEIHLHPYESRSKATMLHYVATEVRF